MSLNDILGGLQGKATEEAEEFVKDRFGDGAAGMVGQFLGGKKDDSDDSGDKDDSSDGKDDDSDDKDNNKSDDDSDDDSK